MSLWEFINDAASIATLITFPIGIAGGIATFASWRNKMARTFISIATLALIFLFGAYIIVLTGWLKPSLREVHDQTFINQRVPLDGYAYYNCKFENVTFVINGTAPVAMSRSIIGAYAIVTDNKQISNAIELLNDLGLLRVPLMLNGKVVKPFGESPTFLPPSGTPPPGIGPN